MAGPISQEAETSELKKTFESEVRIIKDVGEFTHVINFRPNNMDLAIKFQLFDTYPREIPQIMIQSKLMHEGQAEELKSFLNKKSKTMTGKNMIKTLYEEARKWITEQGLDSILESVTERGAGKHKDKQDKKRTRKEKLKESKEKQEAQEQVDEKKASMKTAEEVISRIMWDDNLPSDDFIVGYIDRFKGVLEKNFSAFSWEDIASVDYTVLAIPKHRIQYFKYKDIKIWDKNSRIDNMFGSTGSGLTITDVMEKYEAFAQKNVGQGQGQGQLDNDSDSDDDIEINVGEIKGAEVEDELRPNYFVCLRITDKEVCEGVAAMQDSILEVEPRYAECIIPPCRLHITMCTLGLDTPEQLAEACRVLREAKDELAALAEKKTQVKMEGCSNFYNRVLYATIHHDEKFIDFVDNLRRILKQGGVEIRDKYDYVPHMTIMKTTRPVSRAMGTKDISYSIYEHFKDMYFGHQSLDGIFLCPMTTDQREDGFYETPCELKFE